MIGSSPLARSTRSGSCSASRSCWCCRSRSERAGRTWWPPRSSTSATTRFLIAAYRFGDLSKVYPLARGLSPLIVAAGAFVFAGEQLSLIALAGGRGRVCRYREPFGRERRDAPGRASPWRRLRGRHCAVHRRVHRHRCDGCPTVGACAELHRMVGYPQRPADAARRGGGAPRRARATSRRPRVEIGGRRCPPVSPPTGSWCGRSPSRRWRRSSALRETSVLFAAIIGVKLLGEPLGARRILAAALVAAGLVMIEWG